jgi:hypothetical protein
VHTGFWCGNLNEVDHSGNLDLGGSIILKLIFSKYVWGMTWIAVTQNREKRLALMKLSSPIKLNSGNFLTSSEAVRF